MCVQQSRAYQYPFLTSFEGLFRRDPTRTRPIGLLVHMFTVPVLQGPTVLLFYRPTVLLVYRSAAPVLQEAYGIVSPEFYNTRTTVLIVHSSIVPKLQEVSVPLRPHSTLSPYV